MFIGHRAQKGEHSESPGKRDIVSPKETRKLLDKLRVDAGLPIVKDPPQATKVTLNSSFCNLEAANRNIKIKPFDENNFDVVNWSID